jgi:orotate phosphoribosyltransferase
VNKDLLWQFLALTGGAPTIGLQICRLAKGLGMKFDVVAGPTEGGVVLSQWVAIAARRLGMKPIPVFVDEGKIGEGDLAEVLGILTEGSGSVNPIERAITKLKALIAFAKNPDRIVKRGYEKTVKGKRVLVVDDITTTGDSIKKTIDALKAAGAIVVGVICIWNRGGVKDVGAPVLESLVQKNIPAFDEVGCPLCKELLDSGGRRGTPITPTPGHGTKFLESLEAQGEDGKRTMMVLRGDYIGRPDALADEQKPGGGTVTGEGAPPVA